MKNILLGALVILALWFLIFFNGFDRCKACGKVKPPRSYGAICAHCGEKFAAKHPRLTVLTYILVPISIALIFIYNHLF